MNELGSEYKGQKKTLFNSKLTEEDTAIVVDDVITKIKTGSLSHDLQIEMEAKKKSGLARATATNKIA